MVRKPREFPCEREDSTCLLSQKTLVDKNSNNNIPTQMMSVYIYIFLKDVSSCWGIQYYNRSVHSPAERFWDAWKEVETLSANQSVRVLQESPLSFTFTNHFIYCNPCTSSLMSCTRISLVCCSFGVQLWKQPYRTTMCNLLPSHYFPVEQVFVQNNV